MQQNLILTHITLSDYDTLSIMSILSVYPVYPAYPVHSVYPVYQVYPGYPLYPVCLFCLSCHSCLSCVVMHCIVKGTNSFVTAVARNKGNCNLIGHVCCYDCIHVHVLILIIIQLLLNFLIWSN